MLDASERGRGTQLRVGVVGAGFVAQVVHLPLLAELADRFVLAGVADPDRTRRRTVAARYGIPDYAAHEDLLAARELDAVVVCAPDATHAEVAVDALAAGLHVLVEKPLCLSVEDADRVIAARDAARRVVLVGYMKRYDPGFEAFAADVAAAPSAPAHIATLTCDPGLTPAFAPPGLRAAAPQPELRGAFLGALVHDVNAVHGLLDAAGIPAAARVIDAAGHPGGGLATATLALGDGLRWTLAWIHVPALGEFRERIEWFARDGVRSLAFPAPYLRHAGAVYRASHGDGAGNRRTERRSWADASTRQLLHFHACVTAGAACRTPAEQARRDIALLTELHDAAAAVAA